MSVVLTIARWMGLIFFTTLFAWASIFNWSVFLRASILRRPHVPSVAPNAGGLAGFIAAILCPIDGISRFAWVPLLADYGTLPWLVSLPFALMWDRHGRTRRSG